MSEVIKAIQEAVIKANPNHGVELEFHETSEAFGASMSRILHVKYVNGNEFLRLRMLLSSLDDIGVVSHFEYRGRGTSETQAIVATLRVEEENYALQYMLA